MIYFAGTAVISPSPRAELCHIGDRLEVMCKITSSTVSFSKWSLEYISESGTTIHLISTITSTMMFDDTQVMDSTEFTFSRSSGLGELPLVSSLYISPVRGSLNGTIISCGEGRGDDPANSANTTVFIVGNNVGALIVTYAYNIILFYFLPTDKNYMRLHLLQITIIPGFQNLVLNMQNISGRTQSQSACVGQMSLYTLL